MIYYYELTLIMNFELSYHCNICTNVFHKKTEDLYNGDEELFCSIQCCETYYHEKSLIIDNYDEEDEKNNLEDTEEYQEDDNELEEFCCENCKEEFIPKYISQVYCCKFCEDEQEENSGYALIKQFRNLQS